MYGTRTETRNKCRIWVEKSLENDEFMTKSVGNMT